MCEVVVYLDLLHLTAEAWENDGGPWRALRTVHSATFRTAWHRTKIELEELVAEIEIEADLEAEWEKRHPEEAEFAQRTRSAANAIAIARTMCRYPGAVSFQNDRGTALSREVARKKPKKVTFAANTNFEPGRPQSKYRRKSPLYQKGVYAAKSSEGWVDASNAANRFYNARQLKVVINPDGQNREDFMNDIAISDYEGIAEHHPR